MSGADISEGSTPHPVGPRVWVLLDDRPGNCTQSLGLAESLGWAYETRELRFGTLAAVHNQLLGASRSGVDRSRSDALEPPWPDLLIAAGGRLAPVARWIRQQSAGRTRTVALGRRAGARADVFDLVVTPANARLWPHPNRVETLLPINRIDAAGFDRAVARWKPAFEPHPAPRIALLVGGASALYHFGAREARELGRQVETLVGDIDGSLFVTTSRRTGEAATRELAAALPDAALFHTWSSQTDDNPFLAMLALADWIVVTGDSESMIAEACSTSKRVSIYPLPRSGRAGWKRALGEALVARALRCPRDANARRPQARMLDALCARAIASGWILPPRDLDDLRERLIASGRAHALGDHSAVAAVPALRETERVAERVRGLLSRR